MNRGRAKWLAAMAALFLLLTGCSDDGGDGDAASGPDPFAENDDATPFQGVPLADGTPKPDFTLTDTDGEEFDFIADTEGSTTLLFFGYTNCPDICPPHLAQIAAVLEMASMPTNVKVVFVTVDPERDTPEVIRAFLDNFDSDFIGLTGDPETIAAAQADAGVPVAIVDEPDENGEYLIGHSGEMRAYAPNGLGYVTFPYGTRQSQMAHDLPLLDQLRSVDDQP